VPKRFLPVAVAVALWWPAPSAAGDMTSAAGSWTGAFVGGGIGGSWIDTGWRTDCLAAAAMPEGCPNDFFQGSSRIGNDNPASFNDSGLRLSTFFGYDRQVARLVVGLEGDVGWAEGERSCAAIPGTWSREIGADGDSAEVRSTWDSSLRARLGALVTPAVLLYSTGGLTLRRQEIAATCAGDYPAGWCVEPRSETAGGIAVGWTVGGGAELRLARRWSLRGEYRYSEYRNRTYTLFEEAPLDSVAVSVDEKASIAYIGLSRRF